MNFYAADHIDKVLDFPRLIDALKQGFSQPYITPQRMHIDYHNPNDQNENTMLLMPAIRCGKAAGVKIINVATGNEKRELATIQGIYILLDAVSGIPLAVLDAKSLTNWRTAASSALAAGFLATRSAGTLLMVGTGSLAPYLIEAHAVNRPIRNLIIYGRSHEKAKRIATQFAHRFKNVSVADQLSLVVERADIISVATLSKDPLINGNWLRPGQHLDLVGSFKPDMREADDQVIIRSKIYVDDLGFAPAESGDLAIPLQQGVIKEDDILGDLFQLCTGQVQGRSSEDEITLFKSVGHALEDLIAAQMIEKLSRPSG